MRRREELFTTNYAVTYDNWVKQDVSDREGGFFTKYLRGTDVINTSTPNYYLLVKIDNASGKQLYYGYIRTIEQYRAIRKKLGWT